MFAWRCSHTREDPEKVRSDLGSLSVHVVDGLCAHLKLAGRGMDGEVERKVDRPYGLQDRRDILISARNWDSRFTSLARALAEAVGTRTEADLYENLLRCRTAAEREGKLLSKGTTKGELDRLLRSFDAESEAGHRAAESGGGMAEPATTLAESVGCANGGPAEARSPTPTCGDHQTATKGRDEETQKSSEERETPLLKDPITAEIDSPFVSPQGAGGRGGEQQRWRRDESQTDRRRPSQEEKGEIEECGRMAVERNLVEMGYSVT